MFKEGLSITHILIFLAIVLLLFGANRLPDIARSLGRSIGEFKKGRAEGEAAARDAERDARERREKEAANKDKPAGV